jgi:hypothetical protein
MPPLPCAFYSACDSRYFVGVVALLNSLRLVGQAEPFFLVDGGLTPEQRALIADHVTLIPAPPGVDRIFLAPVGPMEHPANVAVILDADVIVIQPVTELVERARGGRLIAFENIWPNHDRFFPEWESALDLKPIRRQPYVNAGQLLVPSSLSTRLLSSWLGGTRQLDARRTWMGKASLSEPFYFGDQDVLNAILASTLDPNELTILDYELAPHPPFPRLSLLDVEWLLCRYADGEQPFFLHHTIAKPWLKATPSNVYSRLLTRLLLAPDVTVRLQPSQLPLRLREGHIAGVDRRRATAQAFLYAHARKQLCRFGIRTRIREWQRAHAIDSV